MTTNNEGTTTMGDKTTIHEPTGEQVTLACDWHGGQASMLYAIASTGALSRGTMMPYDVDTVAEWNADLLGRLHGELVRTAQEADEHSDDDAMADGPTLREWADDVAVLLAEWEAIVDQETGR
jgi:hypothetical protein